MLCGEMLMVWDHTVGEPRLSEVKVLWLRGVYSPTWSHWMDWIQRVALWAGLGQEIKEELFPGSCGHEIQAPYLHKGSFSTASLGGLGVILVEV